MSRDVVFAPEALADLRSLYDFIAHEAGADRARHYTGRITAYCLSLVTFPERGTRREDLRPGLRMIGFHRRVTIAFHVTATTVTIDRILYGGRDLGTVIQEGLVG